MRRVFVFGIFLAMLAIIGAASVGGTESRPMPSVTLTTLDGSGSVAIDSFGGRPVLLSFWASWCGPCRVELPELAKLYGELAGDGFVLLTVNVDNSPVAATRFLSMIEVSVPVYRMISRDMMTLEISGLPTNILIDREGNVVMNSVGYSPTVSEDIRRLVGEMSREADAAGPASGS